MNKDIYIFEWHDNWASSDRLLFEWQINAIRWMELQAVELLGDLRATEFCEAYFKQQTFGDFRAADLRDLIAYKYFFLRCFLMEHVPFASVTLFFRQSRNLIRKIINIITI